MDRRHLKHPLRAAAAIALLVASSSCDRFGGAASPPPEVAMIALDKAAPVPSALEANVLAMLQPGRPTMLAAMPNGTVYVAQAPGADAGSNDVLRIDVGNATPMPCGLTALAVQRALNIQDAPVSRPTKPSTRAAAAASTRATGRFTAITARSDGKLAFAFTGVANAQPFFAIGTFDPDAADGAGTLFVPVDQITLAAAGDRDVATDAARQTLFTAGDDAWLWRATDHDIHAVSIGKLSDAQPTLSTKQIALERVRDETTAQIERSGWEWSATPERGHFLLTDTASRWIRRIDEGGTISHVARFDADAVATLSAATQDAAGRVIVFGCDRDGVAQSLLVQVDSKFTALATSAFTVPAPLDATRLQIDRLLPMPKQPNAFVAYDGVSGAVIKLKLR